MNWIKHKSQVLDSRHYIIVPSISKILGNVTGKGLDVGCGDGEITSILAREKNTSICGIDINESEIDQANASNNNNLTSFHVVNIADKHPPLEVNSYDFAFSNCCLNQLDDTEVVVALNNIAYTLVSGAFVCFFVPNWRWAYDMYQNVQKLDHGIRATTRFGHPQIFRYSKWYMKVLSSAGFESVKSTDILIPQNSNLQTRYSERVGFPLFSCFTAKNRIFKF